MNFIKKISFLLSSVFLFLMISCSNSFSNSTDISLCFNVSQLYNKTSEISRNDILLNNNQVFRGKLNVAIFQIKDVNAPESYVDFDKTKFKKITSSSGDVAIDGTVSVVLNEVPVGVKAFIVAELFNEQNGDLELIYAGLSNTFEVTEGTNVVELELRSIVNKVTYKLTFVLGDGAKWNEDCIAPAIYSEEDASDTILPDSTWISKDGFVFDGWYDNAEYNGTAITSLAERTGDLIFYARWRSANQVATVQFSEPAGGVDAGTNITLTCATENATIYYNFEDKQFDIDSWQDYAWQLYTSDATATSGGITVFAEGSTNLNPVTIYAIAVCDDMENSDVATITYTLNEYTINLDANGGTLGTNVTSPITVRSGNKVNLSGYIPTRTGYTFKGWYEAKNPDFTTPSDIGEFTPSKDNTTNKTKTFYAGWGPISYKVVFDGNSTDASSMDSQEFKYDESKALSQNTFTRTGYTFTGWNTKADGTGQGYSDEETVSNLVSQDGSITLYAQWKENKASITVTLPEYNEVNNLFSVTNKSDSQVTFTPINGYKNYIWYVNGTEKRQNTSNIDFTISSESYSGGVHTVMLVVEDNNGNYYSQEAIVEITK